MIVQYRHVSKRKDLFVGIRMIKNNNFPSIMSYLIMIVNPIGSMYGIFANSWLKIMVNVGKYTIHGSYGHDIHGRYPRWIHPLGHWKTFLHNMDAKFPPCPILIDIFYTFGTLKKLAVQAWPFYIQWRKQVPTPVKVSSTEMVRWPNSSPRCFPGCYFILKDFISYILGN